MINHSISNKMISVNPVGELSAQNNITEVSRRRRTPSKYAESIRELSRMTSKNSRKEKNSESNQDDTPPTNPSRSDKGNYLHCFLPTSKRKLKLSIIIKKNPKPKMKKSCSIVSIEKQKQKEKQKTKNISLLDTLLQVVEQYKADQQNKKDISSPKSLQGGVMENEGARKQGRSRKDKEEEEKYIRFFDRYRNLNEKYEAMENEIIMI